MTGDQQRLLTLEIDTIFGLVPRRTRRHGDGSGDGSGDGNGDGNGDEGLPTVRDTSVRAVWAWSPRARLLALGEGTPVPDAGWDADEPEEPYVPGRPPRALLRLAETLGAGRDAVEGGPSHLFPDPLPAPGPSPLPLLVSDAAGRDAARRLTRPGNWEPGEWDELIAGRLGEWAMAVHDGTPVSICHTPAANDTAAEAGTWTRADFRGRRLAPATAAAWAARERAHREVLFYSTSAGNHASQSVARALGLPPLGWIWKVR